MKTGYYTIYGLFDNISDTLIYIGLTGNSLKRRLCGHRTYNPESMYARELMYFPSIEDGEEWETYLIRYFNLVEKGLNCGYGKCYQGAKQPKEVVDKRVAAMKDYKHSETTKNKIGDANSRKVMCIDTGEIFNSLTAAEKWCGGHNSKISLVCKGKRNTHKGYRWKYVD